MSTNKNVPLRGIADTTKRESALRAGGSRPDLLASLPPLTRMTAVIHLAKNKFADSPIELWLPKEVDVRVDLGDYKFSNRHRYSDYRMFRAKSVIKAGPPAAK